MNKSVFFKRILISSILIALFFPTQEIYKDGGTKTYTSMTYKVIHWNQLEKEDGSHKTGTEFFFFPNNFHPMEYYENLPKK